MKGEEAEESEEDKLLDPIAKSILRDLQLQDESDEAARRGRGGRIRARRPYARRAQASQHLVQHCELLSCRVRVAVAEPLVRDEDDASAVHLWAN